MSSSQSGTHAASSIATSISSPPPSSQLSTSFPTPKSFTLGTGASIYASTFLPALESANSEVILTTCFWAPSSTLSALSSSLLCLNTSSLALYGGRSKIRVFICLSSRSLLQKLFHTSSPKGYAYPPSTWSSKLGLPPAEDLPGLEIVVKSLFFRPFSVLHSKYLIVDRKRVFLPSCNVSWEDWLECAIELEGETVQEVFEFWKSIWVTPDDSIALRTILSEPSGDSPTFVQNSVHVLPAALSRHVLTLPGAPLPTTLLPHPHCSYLRSSIPLPFPLALLSPSLHPQPPATVLNTTLLHLISTAKEQVTLLTPNFTSPPLYHALLSALNRGVDVRLISNRKMMVLEQLLTAGSITEWWVGALVRAYRRTNQRKKKKEEEEEDRRVAGRGGDGSQWSSLDDANFMEEGRLPLSPTAGDRASLPNKGSGRLRVEYFRPFDSSLPESSPSAGMAGPEAVKTHVKLTLVDDEVVVLGSGNMDRASWYTSQELGVMVRGRDVAAKIWGAVERALEGRLEGLCGV